MQIRSCQQQEELETCKDLHVSPPNGVQVHQKAPTSRREMETSIRPDRLTMALSTKGEKHAMQMPAAKSSESADASTTPPPKKREEVGGTKFCCLHGRRAKAAASLLAAMHMRCHECSKHANTLPNIREQAHKTFG